MFIHVNVMVRYVVYLVILSFSQVIVTFANNPNCLKAHTPFKQLGITVLYLSIYYIAIGDLSRMRVITDVFFIPHKNWF